MSAGCPADTTRGYPAKPPPVSRQPSSVFTLREGGRMRLRGLGSVVVATAALLGSELVGIGGLGTASATTLGTVHSWGENNLGQQGGNGLGNVAAIAGGRDHGLALIDGGVKAW